MPGLIEGSLGSRASSLPSIEAVMALCYVCSRYITEVTTVITVVQWQLGYVCSRYNLQVGDYGTVGLNSSSLRTVGLQGVESSWLLQFGVTDCIRSAPVRLQLQALRRRGGVPLQRQARVPGPGPRAFIYTT